MLVLTVLCDIIVNDLFDDRFDFFRWNQLVTRLNDHCKNLTNLIFLMAIEVAENVLIEL